jgi:hypothetical protein
MACSDMKHALFTDVTVLFLYIYIYIYIYIHTYAVEAQTGSGAHPAFYRMGTWAVSPGIKWQGCEADHSSPTIAEVKKTEIYTSPPHLHGVVLSQSSTGTTLPVTVEDHGRKKPAVILIMQKQFVTLTDMKVFMTVVLKMEIAPRRNLISVLGSRLKGIVLA